MSFGNNFGKTWEKRKALGMVNKCPKMVMKDRSFFKPVFWRIKIDASLFLGKWADSSLTRFAIDFMKTYNPRLREVVTTQIYIYNKIYIWQNYMYSGVPKWSAVLIIERLDITWWSDFSWTRKTWHYLGLHSLKGFSRIWMYILYSD